MKNKKLIICVAVILAVLAVLACFMSFSSNKETTNGIYASSELRWLARNDLARDGLAHFSAKEPVNGEFRRESMYFPAEEWQNWLETEKSWSTNTSWDPEVLGWSPSPEDSAFAWQCVDTAKWSIKSENIFPTSNYVDEFIFSVGGSIQTQLNDSYGNRLDFDGGYVPVEYDTNSIKMKCIYKDPETNKDYGLSRPEILVQPLGLDGYTVTINIENPSAELLEQYIYAYEYAVPVPANTELDVIPDAKCIFGSEYCNIFLRLTKDNILETLFCMNDGSKLCVRGYIIDRANDFDHLLYEDEYRCHFRFYNPNDGFFMTDGIFQGTDWSRALAVDWEPIGGFMIY